MRYRLRSLLCLLSFAAMLLPFTSGCARGRATTPLDAPSSDAPSFTRVEDVIYGRKDGMALTLDVFTPSKNANGAAVIYVHSGAWYSSHESLAWKLPQSLIHPLVQRGYTVFAVVHSSQPEYTIPEMLPDIRRAVRYVRFHAARYGINPERIGMLGASSGGHLALMQSTTGDSGKAQAQDPVERVSSRVQAVACFFPPTDFLNYGKPGANALGRGPLKGLPAPFAFHRDDPQTRLATGRQISPINHVSFDDPPTLLIHGDSDPVVPLQQSRTMITRLNAAGVATQLIIKPGAAHGWDNLGKDLSAIANWFDTHLLKD